MKSSRGIGLLLLGVWLIASGIVHIIHLNFIGLSTLLAVVGISAGALLIIGL